MFLYFLSFHLILLFFFFFQAEDGIRDIGVTGVLTCALPILFVISWVNPDERLAKKSFEDYMREGPFAALEAIEAATGERDIHAIGYCVGGTLLAITLA